MGRNKNKNRGNNRHPAQPKQVVAQPAASAASAEQPSPATVQTLILGIIKGIPWSILISTASLIVATLAYNVNSNQADTNKKQAEINQKQSEINQQNQDRATGVTKAQFDFVDEKPSPESLKPFMRKPEGSPLKEDEVLRMDTLNELMTWQPHVTIQNTGTELIDGIRAEVWYDIGHAYGLGVKQAYPIPVQATESTIVDITGFGKLKPKQKAVLAIMPQILNQMMQASTEVYPGKDRCGLFKVKVLCKLVGATTYDSMEPRKEMRFFFHWKNSVFSDREKCEKTSQLRTIVNIY